MNTMLAQRLRWFGLWSTWLALGACSNGDSSPNRGAGDGPGAASTAMAGSGSGSSTGDKDAIPGGITPGGGIRITGSSGSAALPPMDSSCAEGMADTSPVTPTVWLILDGSGSMNTNFGGPTRWQALRSALMDPGGVVERLEHVVRFGMVLYAGDQNADTPEACLNLVTVDPALDNYQNLSGQYPAVELGGYTPTDRALEQVVNTLPVANEEVLDERPDPVFVILATDGAPNDRCMQPRGGGGGGSGLDPVVAQRVIDQVTAGTSMGMKLLVISLAGDDTALAGHLDAVVAATDSKTPPFVPSTRDDLVDTLQAIVGSASCQIALDGEVPEDKGCSGEVSLNGMLLECDAPNGYQLLDKSTLQLMGTACDTFVSTQSLVTAKFPCDVFVPF